MDTIKHLIMFFLKAAFAFLFGALVWWLVSLFFPQMSFSSFVSKSSGKPITEGWLPSPRKYSGLFRPATTTTNIQTFVVPPTPNQYVDTANQNYSYNKYSYMVYTPSGTVFVNPENEVISSAGTSTPEEDTTLPAKSPNALSGERNLTIRNLSIYEGGHVYTGLSFIGEARSTMFRDGKFPIVIVDQSKKVIGVSAALARSDWTVPGWVRFETKITYPLPVGVPCTMIFEELLTQSERITRQPLRVPLSVKCN